MTKVLFPDAAITIHQDSVVQRARILHPGEYVALEDLPDYQREAALAGKIPYARVLDQDAADLLLAEATRARNLVNPGEEDTQYVVPPVLVDDVFNSGPDTQIVERSVPVDVEQE